MEGIVKTEVFPVEKQIRVHTQCSWKIRIHFQYVATSHTFSKTEHGIRYSENIWRTKERGTNKS